MEIQSRKYIITGGPGSGKSTLIKGLRDRGYSCSEEISRRLIVEEVAKDSGCLPWLDVNCFSIKVLAEMKNAWLRESMSLLTFFDRGIPDIIAYLKVAGLPVSEEYYKSLIDHPYASKVFLLPPWSDIYVNDPERWQTFEEAVVIHHEIKETYLSCGFDLIEVPGLPLPDRVDFVLSGIK